MPAPETTAAVEVLCPACGTQSTRAATKCPVCEWPLRTPWRLAGDDDEQQFARSLGSARRRFALVAVLRAARRLEGGDLQAVRRRCACLLDGDFRDEDLRWAAERLDAELDAVPGSVLCHAPSAAVLAARRHDGGHGPLRVSIIDLAGATTVMAVPDGADGDGEYAELAGVHHEPWPATLGKEDATRALLLAGGSAVGPTAARDIDAWCAAPGEGPLTVVLALPGWPVPERVATRVAQSSGAVVRVRRPTAAPESWLLPGDLTAWRLVAESGHREALAIVGGRDGSVHVVGSCGARECHAVLTGPVSAVDASPNGDVVAAGGRDGAVVIVLHDLGPCSAAAHAGRVNAVRLAASGCVVSVGDDGRLLRTEVDASTGQFVPLPALNVGLNGGAVLAVTGRTAAAAGPDGRLRLFDISSGRHEDVLPVGASVSAVAPDPAGRIVATGQLDGSAAAVSVDAEIAHSWTAGPSAITAIAVGSDGEVITGSRSGHVFRWTATDGPQPCRELIGRHADAVVALAAPADGYVLSIGRGDAAVRCWPPLGRE